MTIAFVQHASNHGSSVTTLTVTLGSATTAGNCLIANIACINDTTVTGITLGGSADNWASQVSNSTYSTYQWADPDCAGSQTSVVITFSGSETPLVDVYEFSGIANSSPLNKSNATGGSAGTGAAWTTGATGTTSQAAELIIGFAAGYNAAYANPAITPPSTPWVNATLLEPSTGIWQQSGYQIASSTGTFTYNGTSNMTGSNNEYGAAIGTYGAASGGGSLTITTASLPGATVGDAYSETLEATGGTTPYTWSISAGSLPSWAALDASTGVISGTPVGGDVATVDFTVKVTDSSGGAATLTITTTSLPDATAGTAYSQTLEATGGTTPYTWSVSSGSLPAWASLADSTGVISGTPTSAQTGTTDFTAEVADAVSDTDTQALSVTVDASSSQPDGPTGTWTLAWNDEFNNASGMSGSSNGLDRSKWNVGWYYGPSSPGGTGYDGLSYTASSGGGAIEFYGPGALSFPGGGGMELSCFASGDGPDGASYSGGGHSSTYESGGVNTAGIMNITPNTGYSVPSDIASTVIQASSIVIEVECQMPGPDGVAGSGTDGAYWTYIGLYNCGDCSTPDYPSSGTWTEEIDIWEAFTVDGSKGDDYYTTFHEASSYGSVVSCPSSLASTDLSLAMHKYTVEFTYSTMKCWVDGVLVSTVSPTSAECEAQWAVPQYLNLQLQLKDTYIATGATYDDETATPWIVNYVRVFTQS